MTIAFDEPGSARAMPRYGRVAETRGWARNEVHVGAGCWMMPVQVWRSDVGFEADHRPEELTHNIVSLDVTGAELEGALPGDRWRRADAGDTVLMPSGGEVRSRASRGVRLAHLYFGDAEFGRLAAECLGDRGGDARLAAGRFAVCDPGLRTMARAYLARALDRDDPPGALEMDARATLIGLHLARRHSTRSDSAAAAPAGGLAPWQVARATEYLAANLGADVTLAAVSSVVRLSPEHFCRAFRVSTGRTPMQRLLELRMERAEALLAERDLPVIEVAAACGYEQPGKFARAFRRATGRTPTEWRRSG